MLLLVTVSVDEVLSEVMSELSPGPNEVPLDELSVISAVCQLVSVCSVVTMVSVVCSFEFLVVTVVTMAVVRSAK